MAAAAHDPAFAEKVGIPQKVAKDFNKADTGTGMIQPKKKRRHARLDAGLVRRQPI